MPPRALALPCVFFAPCRINNHGSAVGRSSKMLLAEGTCAGKAQLHRQKLIAHASVTHLWVHYAFAAKAASVMGMLTPRKALITHLRLGYSFDSALASVDNGEIHGCGGATLMSCTTKAEPRVRPASPLCGRGDGTR